MANEVKWIKITTDIFDDEKMTLIDALPEHDSIIVIWFKLLCMAGKQNNGGVFMLNDRIVYTDEMLATIFRRPLNTVRLALSTFEKYGMVETIDNVVTIPNWNKHQSLDAYERKKQQDRERVARKRAERKALAGMSHDTVRQVAECRTLDKEEDIDIDKEEDIDIYIDSPAPPALKKKPVRHKHGEYANVLLTDDELDKLKAEFPDWQERIERLSSYIASTGKVYKSHYATIRNWARKDAEHHAQMPSAEAKGNGFQTSNPFLEMRNEEWDLK